jgi:hypothetical protein
MSATKGKPVLKDSINLAALIVFLASTLFALPACTSKQLDRKQAAELIGGSQPFSQPYVMIIRHGSDRRYLDPISPDETRAQGEARAIENWRTSYPYRAVLVHLGLVDMKAKYISTTMYGGREGRSTYDLDINLSDAGRKLWSESGLEVDASAVPLAKRKLIQITGITGGGAKDTRATAEFSWQWEPTIAGAAMTQGTAEFDRLPSEIKSLFESDSSLPTFKIKTPLGLTGTHQGVANLQRYDDGWRLESIEPAKTSPLNPLD